MSVREWVGSVNTVSLSSLTNQALWAIGSLAFIALVWWLAVHDRPFMELVMVLVFGWTGKSAITAVSRYGKSKTAVPYVEAQERAKAASTPAVAVHAEGQSKVEVSAKEKPITYSEGVTESHEWASGDPRAGIL